MVAILLAKPVLVSRARRTQPRDGDLALTLAVSPRFIPQIDPGAALLKQMLSSFLHVALSYSQEQGKVLRRDSYLCQLPAFDLSSQPLLRHAVATVCFGYRALHQGDQNLLNRAKESYGKTLHLLGRVLRAESQPYDSVTVVLTIKLLTIQNDAVESRSHLVDWTSHQEGLERYVKTKGRGCLDLSVPNERLLWNDMQNGALYGALAKRRSSILTPDELCPVHKDLVNAPFMTYGLQLARLIEETESLCYHLRFSRLVKLWNDLLSLGREMEGRLEDATSFGQKVSRLQQNLVHASDANAFDLTIEEHRVMAANSTFLPFYRLYNENHKPDYAFGFWLGELRMFIIVVKCMLLRLIHYRSNYVRSIPSDRSLESMKIDLETTATHQASELCRTFHFYSTMHSHGNIDFFHIMCTLTQNFFEDIGATEEFSWCQTVGNATRTRLERLIVDQPRTMCRLRDLHEGLSGLSRIRAPLIRERSKAINHSTCQRHVTNVQT